MAGSTSDHSPALSVRGHTVLPLEKVGGVPERKSIVETLVGLENVRVASRGGRSLEIVMQNTGRPKQLDAEIRNAVSAEQR